MPAVLPQQVLAGDLPVAEGIITPSYLLLLAFLWRQDSSVMAHSVCILVASFFLCWFLTTLSPFGVSW